MLPLIVVHFDRTFTPKYSTCSGVGDVCMAGLPPATWAFLHFAKRYSGVWKIYGSVELFHCCLMEVSYFRGFSVCDAEIIYILYHDTPIPSFPCRAIVKP